MFSVGLATFRYADQSPDAVVLFVGSEHRTEWGIASANSNARIFSRIKTLPISVMPGTHEWQFDTSSSRLDLHRTLIVDWPYRCGL